MPPTRESELSSVAELDQQILHHERLREQERGFSCIDWGTMIDLFVIAGLVMLLRCFDEMELVTSVTSSSNFKFTLIHSHDLVCK